MTLDTVYNEIEARLIEKLRTGFNVTGYNKLGTIDIFNDQFVELANGEELAFEFPSILIEFSEGEFTQQGGGVQKSDTVIRIHIGQNLIDYKDKKSKALAYLDFVNKALHGFSGSIFNGLQRERALLDISAGNLMVHVMEYNTSVTDRSASKTVDLASVQAQLDLVYQNPIT